VEFFDLNGNLIEARPLTYQANTTVRLLYPGATVDAQGNPTDWPGWVFTGGFWVPDPTDDAWRDGLRLVYTLGSATATANVSYPPDTATCSANPVVPVPTGTPTTVPGATTTLPGAPTTLPGTPTTTLPAGVTTTLPAGVPPVPGAPATTKPPGFPPATPGPSTLPTTGSDAGDIGVMALLAAAAGSALVLVARRRRET